MNIDLTAIKTSEDIADAFPTRWLYDRYLQYTDVFCEAMPTDTAALLVTEDVALVLQTQKSFTPCMDEIRENWPNFAGRFHGVPIFVNPDEDADGALFLKELPL